MKKKRIFLPKNLPVSAKKAVHFGTPLPKINFGWVPSENITAPCGTYAKMVFFAKPRGFRIQCAYRSFYASINAPYAHLIHKITFYLAKNLQIFAYVQFL